jgi:putative heme-binding domain-containing protein
MKRAPVLAVLAMLWGWSAVVGGLHGQQPGVAAAQGPKLTPEEIFEFQNKQEGAGTAEAGRPVYEKQCAACHRFGSIGTEVGPDLTTIASRFKKKDLLESILWPSKVISDQYKAEMFELKDGKVLVGVVVREDALRVHLRTAESPERPVAVPKAQIAERAEATVSLMPEGLLEGFSQQDISNLLAFLLSAPPGN